MILKAFALYDSKTGAFGVPFFMHHVGAAVRAVSELALDRSTTVGRHPSDFVLYMLGEYDDATGVMSASAPQNLGLAASFLPQQETMPLFDPRPVAVNGEAKEIN